MNGSLGFNLPRAGKPEHGGSLGEETPRQCGTPPQRLCWGMLTSSVFAPALPAPPRPLAWPARSRPGFGCKNRVGPSRCCSRHCRAAHPTPSPAGPGGHHGALPPPEELDRGPVLQEGLAERPSQGMRNETRVILPKAERDEAFGALVLGAVGWRTLVTAQTKGG